MAHTIAHRPANRTRRSKRETRRLHLWVALHARLCECCGLSLPGRCYINAAGQSVCRGCYLCGLPALTQQASAGECVREGKRWEV